MSLDFSEPCNWGIKQLHECEPLMVYHQLDKFSDHAVGIAEVEIFSL